jgi:ferrochelatase
VSSYDAVLLFSFGGPEGPDDVMPFLENVTRGRAIPRERLEQVAEQYLRFGGVSPINAQNRALIDALGAGLDLAGLDMPVYFGNRNWHPLVGDTIDRMIADGHRSVLAIVTSAFGSYSGCRQYREDLDRCLTDRPGSGLVVDKLRPYWNHPGFLDAVTDRLNVTLSELDPSDRDRARLVYTAHSIPTSWTATSPYLDQLEAAAEEVTRRVAPDRDHDLVFQSRSGPPSVPWLEPDIVDHLEAIHGDGETVVVVTPLGFVSDHMEVAFDLDVQARSRADELGVRMLRTPTVGTHPSFVSALVELITERLEDRSPIAAIGRPWACDEGCCELPARPHSQGTAR